MKMLHLTMLLAALLLGSVAQEVDENIDFTRLKKSNFVEEIRNLTEARWPSMM